MAEAKKETKTIVVKESYELSNINQVNEASKVLSSYITKNGLAVNIAGKKYVMVDGWSFAGGLLGLNARITETTDLSKEGEVKYQAKAEIYDRQGVLKGTGIALCSNKENKKKSFDEYAVLSMAQTRAIGKAYRNLLGWVVRMSGFESTPAEEMPKDLPQEKVIQMDETPAFTSGVEKLRKATTEAELKSIWLKLTAKEKQDDEVVAFKDELKRKFAKLNKDENK